MAREGVARQREPGVTRTDLLIRRALPFAVALLTVIGMTVVAVAGGSASRAQVQDSNDTRGTLDTRRVWFEPEAGPPRWTIVTYAPFTEELMRDRGYVFIFLDTTGDERFEYYALIASNGRRFTGSLWRDPRRGADVRLMGLDVRRDTDTNVAVRIPLGPLEIGGFRTVYRWSVVTTFAGPVCRATCIDRVPDQGTFEQPVGLPTPTPTVTPTGTPTPTPTVTPTGTPTVSPSAAPVSRGEGAT
jgi:hypothetical protein